MHDKRAEIQEIKDKIDFDAYKEVENINFDFDDEAEVQAFLDNKNHIKYISDIENVITLIEKSEGAIKLHEIHPKLQTNLQILRAL